MRPKKKMCATFLIVLYISLVHFFRGFLQFWICNHFTKLRYDYHWLLDMRIFINISFLFTIKHRHSLYLKVIVNITSNYHNITHILHFFQLVLFDPRLCCKTDRKGSLQCTLIWHVSPVLAFQGGTKKEND